MLSFDELMTAPSFRNAWVYHPDFSQLYIRVCFRLLEDEYRKCIDVANIEAKNPGNGAFRNFLQYTAEKYPEYSIYVENVMSKRFAQGLLKLGFKRKKHVSDCFYLIRKLELCARCGFDHDHEPKRAQALHMNCRLCLEELNGLGIGNGPDHKCKDHQK